MYTKSNWAFRSAEFIPPRFCDVGCVSSRDSRKFHLILGFCDHDPINNHASAAIRPKSTRITGCWPPKDGNRVKTAGNRDYGKLESFHLG